MNKNYNESKIKAKTLDLSNEPELEKIYQQIFNHKFGVQMFSAFQAMYEMFAQGDLSYDALEMLKLFYNPEFLFEYYNDNKDKFKDGFWFSDTEPKNEKQIFLEMKRLHFLIDQSRKRTEELLNNQ